MTNDERLVSIFQDDIARRRELVRISTVAIGLHEDCICGHRAIIADELDQIARLERNIAINIERRDSKQRLHLRRIGARRLEAAE